MSEVESIPEEEDDDLLFEHHRIIADPRQSLVRIDKFLMARLPNVTRTKIQGGIQEGFVKVNDKNVKVQLQSTSQRCDYGFHAGTSAGHGSYSGKYPHHYSF